MSTTKHCGWKPCDLPQVGLSHYCEVHREQARRNVLRALGFAAPTSLMWRQGDEEFLIADAGVDEETRERVAKAAGWRRS